MPRFRDIVTWQQAELLMQPAFIRLVDNLRKQLEASDWQGTYEEHSIWPKGVSEEVKARVLQLQSQLETATADEAVQMEAQLAELPAPFPGYQLCLAQGNRQIRVDLWELCYHICFQDYDADSGTSPSSDRPEEAGVTIDATLFDAAGEVDWQRLDDKTQRVVQQVFDHLSGG